MSRDRRQGRRGLLVGLGASAALLAVAALLGWLGRPAGTAPGGSDDVAPARPGSSRSAAEAGANGAKDPPADGARFGHNESGAVDAALAYTAVAQRWLYLSETQLAEAVTQTATPASAEALVAQVLEETRRTRYGLAQAQGPVWWWVHPLAWRADTYSADQARVAVWTVSVLSATGAAVPQSEWLTVTVDLEWVGGDWRVAARAERARLR